MSDKNGPDMCADDVPLLQQDDSDDGNNGAASNDAASNDAASNAAAGNGAVSNDTANTEDGNDKKGKKGKKDKKDKKSKKDKKDKKGKKDKYADCDNYFARRFNLDAPFGPRFGPRTQPLVTRSHLMMDLLKTGPISITIVPSENHKLCFHSLWHIQFSSLSCIMRATTVEDKTEVKPEHLPYLTYYERGVLPNGDRMKVFHTWKITFISPNKLEKTGFYSFDQQDLVKCLYCDEDCENLIIGPLPPRDTSQYNIFKDILSDPSGSYGATPYDPAEDFYFDRDLNKFESFLYHVGVVHNKKVYWHNKGFSTFESRLRSFDRCNKTLHQSAHTLSEAGFYYIGNGENDMMLCFCCNQGLMDWEVDDTPWEEHARWAPECNFVLLKRGKRFVKEVAKTANIDKKDLNKLIPSPEQIIKQNMPDLKRELDNEAEAVENTELMSEVKQRVTPSMPDSKLCKICFKEVLQVVFISCAHVIACIECAVSLDECALCREPLTMLMRVYFGNEVEQLKELNYPYFEREVVHVDPESTTVCKICLTEEMSAVFFPCRHINSCAGCISKVDKCPVCSESFVAFLPVFL